jgi:CXXX repeat peptide maturase
MDRTYCGAGKMIALAPNGNIYPCIRYYGYSLNNHKEWAVGNIHDGIDMEKVRPFVLSTNRIQSDEECLNCEVATGCAFCQGFNYDDSAVATNFHRAKYICKMHKARVRANNYFFSKLYNADGIERESNKILKKSLYLLLSDDYITYCSYENSNYNNIKMNENVIVEGLQYALRNFMRPILVHGKSGETLEYREEYNNHDIIHIVHINNYNKAKEQGYKRILPVYNLDDVHNEKMYIENIILNMKTNEIKFLSESVIELLKYTNRINLNITELNRNFNENQYKEQLETISGEILRILEEQQILKEVNLLTDTLYLDRHDNCQAGENTFVVSPTGEIYTCCAFYSNKLEDTIGSLKEGITKDYGSRLHKIECSNLCRNCDTFQCKNCIHINRENTNEFNVSPTFQCRKSHIEREVSLRLKDKLVNFRGIGMINSLIKKETNYLDPIEIFYLDEQFKGYYKYKKQVENQ